MHKSFAVQKLATYFRGYIFQFVFSPANQHDIYTESREL